MFGHYPREVRCIRPPPLQACDVPEGAVLLSASLLDDRVPHDLGSREATVGWFPLDQATRPRAARIASAKRAAP
ncbi:hypothetical protein GCM10009750_02480 [Agromyces salentinus]|uniref:NUDIX hydrolase n=1 Tax=Agromyces salentinus TaxID=269421 RepID=A0ABP4YU36_9MICO